jgi:vacuolar-type H+-ATPase subunit E/Vma4
VWKLGEIRGKTTRLTIEMMHELAKSKKGKCLSTVYTNNRTKLLWECEKGHQFWAKPNAIKDGDTWCPDCSGTKKLTLERMKEEASVRGGRCLSDEYINSGTKLKWRCANGHIWEAKWDEVRNGRWCPECGSHLFTENKCRYIIEQIFKKKFPKNRTVLGNGLEIDGYNSQLKIGFEYQGEQHYKFVEHFHGTEENFYKRVDADIRKLEKAKNKGIKILIIPYTESSTDLRLFEHIVKELKELNIIEREISFDEIHIGNYYSTFEKLNEAKSIAEERKGKCLSKSYISSHHKLLWECEFGHKWRSSLSTIKQGVWCSDCNGTPKGTIEKMQDLAKQFNGICLSDYYTSTTSFLEWKCDQNHVFKRKPVDIKKGLWCPKCAKQKRKKTTLEDLKALAIERGGRCLSTEYKTKDDKYIWECEKGHTWPATYGHVKNSGSWCRKCASDKRKNLVTPKGTIEEMQDLAKQLNGTCLSEHYISNKTYLEWKCDQNHIFKRKPVDVKRVHWCPKCTKPKRKKATIEDLKVFAIERGGRCLSTEYNTKDDKYEWECEKGHTWSATYGSVKNGGTWCGECAIDKRKKRFNKT